MYVILLQLFPSLIIFFNVSAEEMCNYCHPLPATIVAILDNCITENNEKKETIHPLSSPLCIQCYHRDQL